MTDNLIPLYLAAEKVKLSARLLRDAIDCDELPAYNLSRGRLRPRWFVKMSDVLSYLEKCRKEIL